MIGTHTFAFTLAVTLQLGFEMCFGFSRFCTFVVFRNCATCGFPVVQLAAARGKKKKIAKKKKKNAT